MEKFVKVDAKEYAKLGIENGILVPFGAEKFARIIARQGMIGEEVPTYSANGILETTNKVELDPNTNEPGWVVTKVDNGEVVIDDYGHKNEWIIADSTFKKKYEIDPANPSLCRPKGGIQQFVKIPNSISFTAPWGEEMNISEGGYLNVTNLDDVYGISERDFNDTYKEVHNIGEISHNK